MQKDVSKCYEHFKRKNTGEVLMCYSDNKSSFLLFQFLSGNGYSLACLHLSPSMPPSL